ncbi:hypothetical protein [Vampirovibrio sp.]|uniref:hypothetical protein n=1 Tax=Vampirovibrio sp. TaxID=2717857 RepID=UPI00359312BF
MVATVVNLQSVRQRKSKVRVFEALEHFYGEILNRLEDQNKQIDPQEFEEFMVQVLGDHLVSNLSSSGDLTSLDENYRRFDDRLRACLRTKLKTLGHFEKVQKKR